MVKYLDMVNNLQQHFRKFNISHLLYDNNRQIDSLASLASMTNIDIQRIIVVEIRDKPSYVIAPKSMLSQN